MIEVDAIKKKFGDVEAVRNVSFKAQNGQVTGSLALTVQGNRHIKDPLRTLCGGFRLRQSGWYRYKD